MENDFTISCHVSQIRCKYGLRSKEAYGFLFKELTKEIDAEQILMIQLVPCDWPQRMKVTLRSKEVKNEILVQGLPLYGTTVSMKDEDSSITRVTLQNLPASVKHKDIEVEMSKYGVVLRVEHEFIYADGYKTAAVTGTRFVYMASIATRIPSSIEIKPDEHTAFSVAKVIYRAKQIVTQEGVSVTTTPGNVTRNDRSCYACGKSDHISTACPDNTGCKQNDDVFLMYNSKCPLHVMNTEYPFRANDKEYICIEQFVSEAKCLHFGDQRLASMVCEETDPKIMRRIGEKIPGYVNAEWIPHMPRILGEAIFLKFRDPRATGAKDFLLGTGKRVIAESTRNLKYGTGIHISDPSAADKSKWEGENIMGEFLMLARRELMEEKQAEESHDEAGDASSNESVAGSNLSDATSIDSDDESAAEPDHNSVSAAAHDPVSPQLAEIQQLAGSPRQSPTRFVLVIGDDNVADLSGMLSGNYGESNTPHIVKSYSTGDKSIQLVSKEINDGSIACDIENDKVDSVALHLGALDWSTENTPTAGAILAAYQRLLNSICRRFQDPQIVLSGIPLRYLCAAPSDADREQYGVINTEISKMNKMLCSLGKEESNIHFVDNHASIYISPLFESLYDTPTVLNMKGRHILADNLRGGILAAFAQDMHDMGLPEYKEVKTRRSSSS